MGDKGKDRPLLILRSQKKIWTNNKNRQRQSRTNTKINSGANV